LRRRGGVVIRFFVSRRTLRAKHDVFSFFLFLSLSLLTRAKQKKRERRRSEEKFSLSFLPED
jgi:hypothetical protein